jgi:hypothetical protein
MLSYKTNDNVPTVPVSNKPIKLKNLEDQFFVGILKATAEKSRIRIRIWIWIWIWIGVRIQGSDSGIKMSQHWFWICPPVLRQIQVIRQKLVNS